MLLILFDQGKTFSLSEIIKNVESIQIARNIVYIECGYYATWNNGHLTR